MTNGLHSYSLRFAAIFHILSCRLYIWIGSQQHAVDEMTPFLLRNRWRFVFKEKVWHDGTLSAWVYKQTDISLWILLIYNLWFALRVRCLGRPLVFNSPVRARLSCRLSSREHISPLPLGKLLGPSSCCTALIRWGSLRLHQRSWLQ